MPTVTANGIELHFEERGQGEPLILLMGLGAAGSKWDAHAAAYEKHFRCILVDNRGAGGSDKPPGPYTTRMMADDTAGLLQALGVQNARVAGLSMGSAIAQELALAHPHLVRSLVLISSWSRCDRYAQSIFTHFKIARAQLAPADFVQMLQLWIAAAPYYEAHYAQMVADQAGAVEDYMPLHAFAAQCDACRAHDAFERLDHIRVPTLLTVGEADIFTPPRLTAEMHARMAGSEMLVFAGLGHIHHWEDVARFNEQTTRFLLAH